MLEHAIWREQRIPHVLAIYDGSSKIFSVCNIHIKQKKIQKLQNINHTCVTKENKTFKEIYILILLYFIIIYVDLLFVKYSINLKDKLDFIQNRLL